MRCSTVVAIVLSVISVGYGRAAAAQSSPAAGPGRLEVSFGALWVGQLALGSNDANQTTPGGGNLKIFTTSTGLAGAAGLDARVAVRVLRSLDAEVEGSYGTPQLKVSINSDIESAPAVTATDTLQQFTIGAGAMWYVPLLRRMPRLAPFVFAGGGYMRQVHEQRTLVDTGQYYQAGGGVKWPFVERARGFVKGIGVRVDARAMVRRKGVAFDDRGHTSPAVGASAFVRF